ncbi:MAG: YncE family protein [Actinomycetota bacterium]|nr:YncE family protein [Actinomycetota bacterium]
MAERPSRLGVQISMAAIIGFLAAAGCSRDSGLESPAAPLTAPSAAGAQPTASATTQVGAAPRLAPQFRDPLPGMPPVIDNNVYAADGPTMVSAKISDEPAYIYVPNSYGAPYTTVVDQRTHKIIRVLHTGLLDQHVTPSWDLHTLYVEASESNQLVALNPHTGRIEKRIAVRRPYNLYFTPNGRDAVVMAEEFDQIVFSDPHTFKQHAVVTDPSCRGPNHADFSGNGRFFVVTCEFSGSLLKVSTVTHKILGRLSLGPGSQPQDVRLSPDGRTFYVADMGRDRLDRVIWNTFKLAGYTTMPSMPHGIYPSRDGKYLYVSDRGAGEVSVVSLASNKIVDTWTIPGGGTPDMGGVSADGKVLWLSGRDDGYVYGWNTTTGRLLARIHVGGSPHGLLVWPQPGRYSLGHTGNMR